MLNAGMISLFADEKGKNELKKARARTAKRPIRK